MPDDKLEQETKELTEKLRTRDEAERKKAEREFRAAMQKDTAGTVLAMYQNLQAQITLHGQITDATNPLASLLGRVLNVEARMAALEDALIKGRKIAEGKE